MDLPTYTNIWRIEKRLYKLYDFRLPMPVPVTTAAIFVVIVVVWCTLMALLRVPFSTPWHVLWIVPPFVLAWGATRPVIEAKRLDELAASQIRFLLEARTYVRLRPEYEPARVRTAAVVWHRDPVGAPDRRAHTPAPVVRALPTRPLPSAARQAGAAAA
ncbi:conjugal transfer protein [Nocardiopsis changdeensis]|uniref:Conjugal transfer protein n=1 Tax=Nocardiopsis changdeensis TaxID=2831969 RepID=A0A975KTU4_9ACTN|nr:MULTISPECIES: conjugal transfer protein [Nocardiopsis]QUX26422.1 conjugal transfer protein [Nocardiopsis changdeensis]QYX40694.1 conjugal transfer protein [Nocardiopsis sp. MT53]